MYPGTCEQLKLFAGRANNCPRCYFPSEFPCLADGPSVLSASSQESTTVESLFDILQKMDDVDFLWIEAVGDLRTAIDRIEELQARTPNEYVVFDQRNLQVVAQLKSRAAGA